MFNQNNYAMKNFILIVLAVCFTLYTAAQQNYNFKVNVNEDRASQQVIAEQQNLNVVKFIKELQKPDYKSGDPSRDVVIRDLGDAGNAWGLSSGGRTFMWADNDLNSVVFLHRMLNPPGTGYLAYDVSIDNGDTWEVNQQIWDPTGYPYGGKADGDARYPQVVIYNPEGNTDPNNAIVTYFAPTLDATNGASWGGYAWGTNVMTAVNPTAPTMLGHPSPGGDILQSVPDAFHMTTLGKAFAYEPVLVDGFFAGYTGNMVITSGFYNSGTLLFDYTQELLECEIVSGATVANAKAAFGPDGLTGYLGILSNNGGNDLADGAYYPILYKTTDGGTNWDGPYNVQLGGPDGLSCVLSYLTDELLEMLFEPPIPDRTELLFTTAFDCDIAVDAWGNPHMLFVVGLGSGEWSIYTSIEGLPGTGGMIAMIHVTSYDGMDTWVGDTLIRPFTFRGVFAGGNDMSEDTRPYISVTPDGTKMFFSWINTEVPEVNDNVSPDIYCMGHDVTNRTYSNLYNVTAFTSVMWQAWMGTASYYVFDYGGEYEIPFVCQTMNPANNLDPVAFKYVDGFTLTDADLGVWTSSAEIEDNRISMSQNYPNPFNYSTIITTYLEEPACLSLEITNILGQKVYMEDRGYTGRGTVQFTLSADDFDPGIYFYTVRFGNQAVTKQMIVK